MISTSDCESSMDNFIVTIHIIKEDIFFHKGTSKVHLLINLVELIIVVSLIDQLLWRIELCERA